MRGENTTFTFMSEEINPVTTDWASVLKIFVLSVKVSRDEAE